MAIQVRGDAMALPPSGGQALQWQGKELPSLLLVLPPVQLAGSDAPLADVYQQVTGNNRLFSPERNVFVWKVNE